MKRCRNSPEQLAKRRAYWQENREKINAVRREAYKADPERFKSRQRDYCTENKEQIKAKHHENRVANPALGMFNSAKQRAKKLGIPFELELTDIQVPTHCPILGIKLTVGKDKCSWSSPSLDRIAPELGYVKGNIQVISRQANTMKLHATADQLRSFAAWILENFG